VKGLPFRWKLTLLIALTSGVTLALAFVGLYVHDFYEFRADVERRLDPPRRALVEKLTPLLEEKSPDLENSLQGLLADPLIDAAALYSTDNRQLARFSPTEGEPFEPSSTRIGQWVGSGRGIVQTVIKKNGHVLGVLFLRAKLTDAERDRFAILLQAAGIIFLV